MARKQFFALFLCSLTGWIIAQGTLALLPVYAVRLGADSSSIGNYLALAFGTLTVGTILAGWLSDRFQRRKAMLVIAGLVSIPATWLMGQASAYWQLVILTAVVWFCLGVSFTVISILAGLFAGETERGKIFGALALNTSLGALIGGAVSGPIVDQQGYSAWFLLAAACWVLQPLITLFMQDRVVSGVPHDAAATRLATPALGGMFYLLLLAHVIAFGANFFSVLGRPLLMDDLGFDSAAISGAVAVGGTVSLPFPLLVGWLSDRIGRYPLLIVCFVISALGLFVLAVSESLMHFWISSILLAAMGVALAIGPALVTDLVPPNILGSALSWYGFAPPAGGILGFMLTGYAIQGFGMTATFVGGALLTLIAAALLLRVQRSRQLAPG
ncbi:MAG: MFS transporter [Anaerolineae bacterium]